MRNEKSGIGESAPAGTQRKHPAGVKPRQGRRTPPSPSVTPPLAGEAFLRQFPKGAPARGAVGVSRLRGALPPGGRDILQNPAGPCMRRGRCPHRPASFPAAAAFSGPMKNHRPLRRLGAARKDTGKGNAAMHPSVCACGASTSPCRGGFMGGSRHIGSPARGAGGEAD